MVYCNSTASLDNLNTAVFVLSGSTVAGAVPLGCVMASSEDVETLTAAFKALISILPDYAFFGRGKIAGPLTILTDDSASERRALQIVWPIAQLHLCVSHFLQSMWHWLWSDKSRVTGNDRVTCMLLIKCLLYSSSEQALMNVKAEIESSQFPVFEKRIDSYWQRKEEWALCFRTQFPTRGNYTNNYSEASIRIIKDVLFQRQKAWNAVQLFQMVHITMELYYQRRLLSLASNRLDHFVSLKYTLAGVKLGSTSFDDVTATEEDPDVYMVRSHTDPHNHWIVDLQLGECSCPVGYNGTPCKHQLVAATKYMKSTINKIPTDSPKGRQLLAGVALGKDCQPISFYSSLHQTSDEEYLQFLSVDIQWHNEDIRHSFKESAMLDDDLFQQKRQKTTMKETEIPSSGEDKNQTIETVKTSLNEVMVDLEIGLAPNMTNNDGYLIAVKKFCENYWKCRGKSTHPPTKQQRLVSALHTFGSHTGITKHRQRIRVQPTALNRQKHVKNSSSVPAKAGRPSVFNSRRATHTTPSVSRYVMPKRIQKIKRQHSLSASIQQNSKNA